MLGLWSGLGDRLFLIRPGNERKVRTPEGRVLGNAQAEQSDMSATENIPPMAKIIGQVRVKWWGKSLPHAWQHVWQGKHHLEQNQIGERFERISLHVRGLHG